MFKICSEFVERLRKYCENPVTSRSFIRYPLQSYTGKCTVLANTYMQIHTCRHSLWRLNRNKQNRSTCVQGSWPNKRKVRQLQTLLSKNNLVCERFLNSALSNIKHFLHNAVPSTYHSLTHSTMRPLLSDICTCKSSHIFYHDCSRTICKLITGGLEVYAH